MCEVVGDRAVGLSPERTEELMVAALHGDGRAREELVEVYADLVRAVIRDHGHGTENVSDGCQTAWLQMVENLGRLLDPAQASSSLVASAQ